MDAPNDDFIRRRYITYMKEQKNSFVSFGDGEPEDYDGVLDRIHIDGSNIFSGLSGICDLAETV